VPVNEAFDFATARFKSAADLIDQCEARRPSCRRICPLSRGFRRRFVARSPDYGRVRRSPPFAQPNPAPYTFKGERQPASTAARYSAQGTGVAGNTTVYLVMAAGAIDTEVRRHGKAILINSSR
jgi:hypothetical protein